MVMSDIQPVAPCIAPPLFVKNLPGPDEGAKVFYWQNPACGKFYARATAHPDPENAPPESFEVLQPTLTTRTAVPSTERPGMWLLGPTYQSVIVASNAPWTGVELFGPA